MIHTLENEYLKISVKDEGAELCSIYSKAGGQEVLWQADPAYWKRHAPILFPNVGKNYGNHFLYKGNEYPTSQHGFARDCTFVCSHTAQDSITHSLTSNAQTMENYPFPFLLEVTHTLEGSTLEIAWHVKNLGSETMYFTIGGHPAFRVPILPDTAQEDYFLQFQTDHLEYILLDPETGTACPDKTEELILENGFCPIKKDMFARDALIFDGQITWAAITYPDKQPYVSLSCPGFPNFGIWAAPKAPFVCLEPWDGRCDNYGFQDDISQKPGILSLKKEEDYNNSYKITVHSRTK